MFYHNGGAYFLLCMEQFATFNPVPVPDFVPASWLDDEVPERTKEML